MKSQQGGFTISELLVVVMVIFALGFVCVAGFYGTLIKGNFWYTESGVLTKLRVDHPQVESVVTTTRNAWKYSRIMVMEDGRRTLYCLDTDLFWNYDLHPCED